MSEKTKAFLGKEIEVDLMGVKLKIGVGHINLALLLLAMFLGERAWSRFEEDQREHWKLTRYTADIVATHTTEIAVLQTDMGNVKSRLAKQLKPPKNAD